MDKQEDSIRELANYIADMTDITELPREVVVEHLCAALYNALAGLESVRQIRESGSMAGEHAVLYSQRVL